MSQVSRIPFHWQPLAAGLAATLLASCGGGGGSPTPSPPPPSNNAPQFTSGNTATVAENSTGTVYMATASDADGDTLTFSIAGGADASAFTLSGGVLSFATAPNFDAFADADNDNVYSVNLEVSDGRGGTATRTVDVTVTNDREGIRVTRIATGFTDPVGLAPVFSRNVLVGEKNGTVWNVDGRDGTRQPFTTIPLPAGGELLDIAGRVIGGTTLLPAALYRDPNGVTVMFAMHLPTRSEVRLAAGAPGEALGKIAYGPEALLGTVDQVVVAIGDPSGQRAQGTSGYGRLFAPRPPSGGAAGSANPIGRGLRQPGGLVRIQSSDLLISDQGGSFFQEINELVSPLPNNFGWPFFEGTTELQAGGPSGLTEPKFTYQSGSGPKEGSAIVMGDHYVGSITDLSNRVIFADGDKIFAINFNLEADTFENRSADFTPDVGTIDEVVQIITDGSGVLYILDADGELFRVDAS